MAILVEAISIVLRTDSVISKYPGGWEGFVAAISNQTLCTDGELVRVGYMTPQDTKAFVERMARHGLDYLREGKACDLVVADQQRGLAARCDWAEFGHVNWQGDPAKRVAACRAVPTVRTDLVTPDGWTYDGSLSAKFTFVETGRTSEFMDFLRHEDGLDVYRDLRTGKELFIVRPRT